MRTRRSALAAIAPIAVTLVSVTAVAVAPAGAHSGGRAQLYVDSIPEGFGPFDEGAMPPHLFEAERHAALVAYDARIRTPTLDDFDERMSRSLGD